MAAMDRLTSVLISYIEYSRVHDMGWDPGNPTESLPAKVDGSVSCGNFFQRYALSDMFFMVNQ